MLFGSVTDTGRPRSGSTVVLAACPSGLVTLVAVGTPLVMV